MMADGNGARNSGGSLSVRAFELLQWLRSRAASHEQYGGVLEFRIDTLTPDDARYILTFNDVDIQRNAGDVGGTRHVHAIRRDIASDKYLVLGEPFHVGANGLLINGQHRLIALAGCEDGVIRHAKFIYTSDPNAYHAIDSRSRARGMAAIAKAAGVDIPPTVIGALVLEVHDGVKSNTLNSLTKTERIFMAADHPAKDGVIEIYRASKPKASAAELAPVARCIAYDAPLAMEFFHALFTSRTVINGMESRPLVLTQQWRAETRDKSMRSREVFYRYVRAFKAHLNGESPQIIKYSASYAMVTLP